MEVLKSENKKRVLPSWMTAQDERKGVLLKLPKKRRTAVVAATRTPTMKTVYCMNEAEMVDVALVILTEGRKQEKPWEQPALVNSDKPPLSPSCSVSPHTSSPGSSEEEDSGKDVPAPVFSPAQGPGVPNSTCSKSPKEEEEEEEEDVLKYVREIFFS